MSNLPHAPLEECEIPEEVKSSAQGICKDSSHSVNCQLSAFSLK